MAHRLPGGGVEFQAPYFARLGESQHVPAIDEVGVDIGLEREPCDQVKQTQDRVGSAAPARQRQPLGSGKLAASEASFWSWPPSCPTFRV